MSYTHHRPLFLVTTGLLIWMLMQALGANAQDTTANMSAVMDPGYNAQQETIIYVCLIAIAAMLAVVCLLLWFLVDRSKREIRAVKRILPEIVDKLRARAEVADEEDGQVVSGTMRAPEFEAGFMTSSSMADNSVDRYQSRYNQQRPVDRQHSASWNSTTFSSGCDVSTRDKLTNRVGSSQPVQSERTNWVEAEVAHDTTDRERNSFGNEVGGLSGIAVRPSREETAATNSPANWQNALALGTYHQSETRMVDKRPELSAARVEASLLSARQAQPTGPNSTYVYDNPDMFRGDHTQTNHTDIMTQPNDQNKLKYRNSYYESHV